MYDFAYLTYALLFLPLWLIMFIFRKDLRKPMLLVGVVFGAIAPTSEFIWFLRDYWNPIKFISPTTFIYQDFIFVFILAGISLFLFRFVTGKQLSTNLEFSWPRLWLAIFLVLIPAVLIYTTGLNSVHSMFISSGLLGVWILYSRRDLVKNAFFNLIALSLLSFIGFSILQNFYPNIVQDWWLYKSNIVIFSVPLEEAIWLGINGFGLGLVYEYLFTPKNRESR